MAKAHTTLTQDLLKELLHYDPDTGVFTCRKTRGNKSAGSVVGSIKTDGYLGFQLIEKDYRAHRLAWLYMTGEWPEVLIDHKNGNPLDNRFENLREASHSENCQNIKVATKRSKTGFLGVRKMTAPNGRISFQAAIRVDKQFIYLGTHPTAEAAHAAYMAAKRDLHGAYIS